MLERARAARPTARLEGVLVQPMAEGGREILLGTVRDPQFGAMIMVGFGGIYVEVLGDVAMRLCPLATAEALEMFGELRMAPLLAGIRGEAPADMAALAAATCRLAQLAVELPELAEVEVNPLMAGPRGAIAVDARGRLAREDDPMRAGNRIGERTTSMQPAS
jgi:acetyltransferase